MLGNGMHFNIYSMLHFCKMWGQGRVMLGTLGWSVSVALMVLQVNGKEQEQFRSNNEDISMHFKGSD